MPRKPKQYGFIAKLVMDPTHYKGRRVNGLLYKEAAITHMNFIADLMAHIAAYGSYVLVEYGPDGEPINPRDGYTSTRERDHD